MASTIRKRLCQPDTGAAIYGSYGYNQSDLLPRFNVKLPSHELEMRSEMPSIPHHEGGRTIWYGCAGLAVHSFNKRISDTAERRSSAISALQELVQSSTFFSLPTEVPVLQWQHEHRALHHGHEIRASCAFLIDGIPHCVVGGWCSTKVLARRECAERALGLFMHRWAVLGLQDANVTASSVEPPGEEITDLAALQYFCLRFAPLGGVLPKETFHWEDDLCQCTIRVHLFSVPHHFPGQPKPSAEEAADDTARRILWYLRCPGYETAFAVDLEESCALSHVPGLAVLPSWEQPPRSRPAASMPAATCSQLAAMVAKTVRQPQSWRQSGTCGEADQAPLLKAREKRGAGSSKETAISTSAVTGEDGHDSDEEMGPGSELACGSSATHGQVPEQTDQEGSPGPTEVEVREEAMISSAVLVKEERNSVEEPGNSPSHVVHPPSGPASSSTVSTNRIFSGLAPTTYVDPSVMLQSGERKVTIVYPDAASAVASRSQGSLQGESPPMHAATAMVAGCAEVSEALSSAQSRPGGPGEAPASPAEASIGLPKWCRGGK